MSQSVAERLSMPIELKTEAPNLEFRGRLVASRAGSLTAFQTQESGLCRHTSARPLYYWAS